MKTVKCHGIRPVWLNPLVEKLEYLSTITNISAVFPYSGICLSADDFENLRIFENHLVEDR